MAVDVEGVAGAMADANIGAAGDDEGEEARLLRVRVAVALVGVWLRSPCPCCGGEGACACMCAPCCAALAMLREWAAGPGNREALECE